MMLLNIQSIRNKTDELYLYLDTGNYPDVLVITEHWLNQDESLFLPNYILLAKYCRTVTIHGGTLI